MSITKIAKFGTESTRRVAAFARRLLGDSSGLAFIEFAYVLPVFLGFGLVGLEFTNVVLARQKTERIASTVADLIASNQVPPNERQIGDMFAAVPQIARPFEFGAGGQVIITAVLGIYDDTDNEVQNKVAWQRCMEADGFASSFGTQWTSTNDIADGPEVILPNTLELGQNQMVVVAEVFYPYQSIISQSLVGFILPQNNMFREVATFRTRGGAIMNVTPVTGQAMHAC
ncbi:pilus assembly protein [Erythrobacter sp. NFXS35]|uniref:TadE/TadG family type IV pilus assembly protein n=1 Tax=Erythrobacter sp. NFXS35 TaxID=2818436 RepID=UPI0032E005BF